MSRTPKPQANWVSRQICIPIPNPSWMIRNNQQCCPHQIFHGRVETQHSGKDLHLGKDTHQHHWMVHPSLPDQQSVALSPRNQSQKQRDKSPKTTEPHDTKIHKYKCECLRPKCDGCRLPHDRGTNQSLQERIMFQLSPTWTHWEGMPQ